MRKTAGIVRGLCLTAVCLSLYGYFYYVYVPLLSPFQIILIPLLCLTAGLTVVRVEWGALWFVFAFPLVNNLPYYFGLYEHIPHAPVGLVLFLAFFIGWLANASFSGSRLSFPAGFLRPLAILSGIVLVSGWITFWRYANFPPFLAERARELIVNVNQVRAGGALMSNVFNSLNYLSGFLFLGIMLDILRRRAGVRKWLAVMAVSTGISLVFALVQRSVSLELGNMPTWYGLGQLNSTFKDPNAFGAFLSAVLPPLLALALSCRRGARVLSFLLVVLVLAIFPATGSRSGFLAICLSGGAFAFIVLRGQRAAARAKVLRSLTVLAAFLVLIVSVSFFQGGSRLFQRLSGSLEAATWPDFMSGLFTGKLALWETAGRMVGDYPVTGVGMGAYIVELPNYLQAVGRPSVATDSAENFFIQAGAELGLAGLGLFLWVLVVIFGHILKDIRSSRTSVGPASQAFYIPVGVFCGLLALVVNFLFHSYIGSFEVVYTFWFLVALGFSRFPGEDQKEMRATKNPSWPVVATVVVAVFGLIHLWNSTRSLSLESRTARFGWSQNYGLYKPETDPGRYAFRWAKRSAGLTVEGPGSALVIPLRVPHPDVGQSAVRAKVFLADDAFRKTALLQEVVFTSSDWIELEVPLSHRPPEKIYLVFETDRDWQPARSLGVPDFRRLALGLGEIWSRYPPEISGKPLGLATTVPAQKWQGEFGENLVGKGTSRIDVSLDKPDPVLRLWLKGQKALGIGPLVVIRLDGRTIGKTQVREEDWTPLILTPRVEAGPHVLTIEFTNDFQDAATGEDRNLYLGQVEILTLE